MERTETLLRSIEEGLQVLQADPEAGRLLLEACAQEVVGEVERIEGFLANPPEVVAAAATPAWMLRQGLQCYYQGNLEVARCLEDLEAAHLAAARQLFAEGQDTLQQAYEMVTEDLVFEL
ncbi:MAG: hypothetical protein ACYCW6_28025 [Candidatus Xenobia bacterium]